MNSGLSPSPLPSGAPDIPPPPASRGILLTPSDATRPLRGVEGPRVSDCGGPAEPDPSWVQAAEAGTALAMSSSSKRASLLPAIIVRIPYSTKETTRPATQL